MPFRYYDIKVERLEPPLGLSEGGTVVNVKRNYDLHFRLLDKDCMIVQTRRLNSKPMEGSVLLPPLGKEN